ncbi:MAG: hypothetical protein ABSD46_09910 [Bacteroidota bacterium]
MFKSRTVFILGAGASIPYGFPLGYKLVSDIIDNISLSSKTTVLAKVATELQGSVSQFEYEKIQRLRESLLKAVVESIDDFLQARPEFLNVGKAVIAQALIPYENEARLFARDNKENWYSMIFEVLRRDIEKLEDRQISFITFNYDRSLEHYLFTQLKEYLNLSFDNCKMVMNKIPIIHVYGHIGNLGWQDNKIYRKYEPTDDVQNILYGMMHLSVIHERNDADENFIEAQRLIQQSEKVRFLGYGFHDTNTERLQVAANAKGKDIRATSYGLSKLQRQNIIKYFGNPSYNIPLDKEEKRDIVRFFKEWTPLE